MPVKAVQCRLKELGYHEVGSIDGIIGPSTRAAILAFRDDAALPLVPTIDVALEEALKLANPRQVAPERAAGAPGNSRIVAAANAQIGLGVLGAAGSITSQIAPALREAEQARDTASRIFALAGLEEWLAMALPWIGMVMFVGVILYALKARAARTEDHRTGRTP
jgi:peptidoglycan hydrolase-like protein with peptidoglycan-binding domain